jgi:hypothetical protein
VSKLIPYLVSTKNHVSSYQGSKYTHTHTGSFCYVMLIHSLSWQSLQFSESVPPFLPKRKRGSKRFCCDCLMARTVSGAVSPFVSCKKTPLFF